ncbi:MAG: YafY family transcriptional regulator [Spirochaetaceae bacterium]|jgi:predicted DNA-binding transcriptional regulator YafY|nr:YafY family transcriptional regulator [Spirochaetaceae bacterium]
MQISRLFEIVYILLERGSATAGDLAKRFGVSTRTIYRDVDTLSSADIPVYTDRGKGGGIRLLSDFVMNKALLSESEQNEILFALQSLKAAQGADVERILLRLGGIFKRDSVDWIDMDFSGWGGGDAEKEKFNTLKRGILERRVIAFDYYNTAGEKTSRRMEPAKLRFKGGHWYIQGFCRDKKEVRVFKLRRMREVRLTGEQFSGSGNAGRIETRTAAPNRRYETPPLDELSYGRRISPVVLELRFSPGTAYRVYDEFSPELIRRNPDESLTVTAAYPEDEWVYGHLLSFGPDVEVLFPPHIRDILKERASAVAELYRGNGGNLR